MSTLAFRSVGKTRQSAHQVLHEIDLDVADGEFVVLVGPSGCGKSTLLRMTAGLESVTTGQILIGSRVVNDVPSQMRDVAMVFQNYALYPHMSVAENIAFGMKMRGTPQDLIHRRIHETARMLSLDALLERKPGELSGGQRQRVAMGRAIVREPQLFLFDEPLSNLDARLRSQMRVEMRSLHARLGTTTLYVTHDQVEAMTLAQRIVVLNQGRIEQIGTPAQIYDRPQTVFVAGFMGVPAMNLLKGQLAADGRTFKVDGVANGNICVANTPVHRLLVPGHPYVLGIRPEHILAGGVEGGCTTRLPVKLCEMLGADNLVFGAWGGQELIVRLPYQQCVVPGDAIDVLLPPERLHFFDAGTGHRVG
ncbi:MULTISPECIES: sn-glycerol-3-phosphate ABC transporter ATP-binding protein UgpC [unclassified Paraburkholderia]|uniref:sn-glycerol-3-phosphate ABC transporter ATP-binding protein UgpC n=1 Tax=unclassified Paraburkholderia TaxID=2615204 RepID=UPI0016123006|nr:MULTISPECIES: sn-glycerol-3-phosphate ABC transporter ATP-binding protein UgpC [unclassified Paraburkholderia]MBB5445515.1 sn-glycerol 3-phosphate transport system ATP-binding protein [Paraburkholderia sp. WSM4177]MBB5486005.1 sn-glycerol 3-phosphate transport system ATP-binding protein [Paraburkholderia sp. WSM4180]